MFNMFTIYFNDDDVDEISYLFGFEKIFWRCS